MSPSEVLDAGFDQWLGSAGDPAALGSPPPNVRVELFLPQNEFLPSVESCPKLAPVDDNHPPGIIGVPKSAFAPTCPRWAVSLRRVGRCS